MATDLFHRRQQPWRTWETFAERPIRKSSLRIGAPVIGLSRSREIVPARRASRIRPLALWCSTRARIGNEWHGDHFRCNTALQLSSCLVFRCCCPFCFSRAFHVESVGAAGKLGHSSWPAGETLELAGEAFVLGSHNLVMAGKTRTRA